MKHKRNITLIAIIAFACALLAFIIDLGELYPSRLQNLIDILMMTFIFFVMGTSCYGFTITIYEIIQKAKA